MPFTGEGTGIENADDVFFSNVSDNDTLLYDGTTAKWQNSTISSSHQHVVADISDVTSIGQSIATASNATSVRTLISAWQPVSGTRTKVVQDFTDVNAPRATSRTDVVIEWRGGPSQPVNMLTGVDEWTLVG